MKVLKGYLLVFVLMVLSTLLIGCSTKPLDGRSISEVEEMVNNWNTGQLPEQQKLNASLQKLNAFLSAEVKSDDKVNSALKTVSSIRRRTRVERDKAHAAYAAAVSRIKVEYPKVKFRKSSESGWEIVEQYLLQRDFEQNAAWRRYIEKCKKIESENRDERDRIKAEWDAAAREMGTAHAGYYLKPKYQPKIDALIEKLGKEKAELKAEVEAEGEAIKQEYHRVYAEAKAKLEAARKTKERRINEINYSLTAAEHELSQLRSQAEAEARRKCKTELGAQSAHDLTIFYKVFGEPDSKQLIAGKYYFYYKCKDGMVQMELSCASLKETDIVRVVSVNVF